MNELKSATEILLNPNILIPKVYLYYTHTVVKDETKWWQFKKLLTTKDERCRKELKVLEVNRTENGITYTMRDFEFTESGRDIEIGVVFENGLSRYQKHTLNCTPGTVMRFTYKLSWSCT